MLKKRLVGLTTGVLLLTACTNVQGEEGQVNVLGEEASQEISMDEAKEIAFNHANVDGSKATFDDEEYDERNNEYELEFHVDGVEYEYDISATDGTILEAEKDDDADDDDRDNNDDRSEKENKENSEFISLDEAKEIAFDHAGVDGSKAKFDDEELDESDKKYELEFYVDGVEYEYDIHAVTGEILDVEKDSADDDNDDDDDDRAEREVKQASKQEKAPKQEASKQETKQKAPKKQEKQQPAKKPEAKPASNQTPQQNQSSTISRDKALSIAMNYVGVSRGQIYDLEVELDNDDGYTMYEIEFEVNGMEYEFDINAKDGSILDFEKDD